MIFRSLLLTLAFASGLTAQEPSWTTNHVPFHVVGNVYYVGSEDLGSYLIVTPQGDILINSNLKTSVPQIRKNIETLGFKFSDIKILLTSQAHFDHVAGSAEIKRLTHAKYEVMDADVAVVESGGHSDFQYGRSKGSWFEPTRVDRVLHDGDEVKLGGTTLVAHLTPGHTKGCTTWTIRLHDGANTYNVVIVGGASANSGYQLIGDSEYPQMATDFARAFITLRSLPCDIFLGAHGIYFDLEAKFARLQPGVANPFLDPEGYKSYITERQQTFEKQLASARSKLLQ